jgi:hypothetical protein
MRAYFSVSLVLLILLGTGVQAQDDLYRKDPVSGSFYKVNPQSYGLPASTVDTTVVLTVQGKDTTKVVTLRKDDPARGIDQTLRKMFGLQVLMVVVSVASAVITLIAMP